MNATFALVADLQNSFASDLINEVYCRWSGRLEYPAHVCIFIKRLHLHQLNGPDWRRFELSDGFGSRSGSQAVTGRGVPPCAPVNGSGVERRIFLECFWKRADSRAQCSSQRQQQSGWIHRSYWGDIWPIKKKKKKAHAVSCVSRKRTRKKVRGRNQGSAAVRFYFPPSSVETRALRKHTAFLYAPLHLFIYFPAESLHSPASFYSLVIMCKISLYYIS